MRGFKAKPCLGNTKPSLWYGRRQVTQPVGRSEAGVADTSDDRR
jgi:hypothetical protein